MSERRDCDDEDVPPVDDEDEDDPDEDVEYLVDVELVSCVSTSVPKSAQLSQTSNSAPSTFTVLGDPVSAPHISH